jgi:RNA polymerase sigma-70 factor (ECF subfamily)
MDMIEPIPASPGTTDVRCQAVGAESVTAADFAAAYAERVHRFAAMVTRNDQDSEDLAQEALVKALRSLPRLDPSRGQLEAWVWRIVINTARDAGRVRRRRLLLSERWARDELVSTGVRTVEGDAMERLRDSELVGEVRRLPERARTMIALRFGAQLGTNDIAQQLGMTPPAVSMAIGRALSRLRRNLENLP